LKVWLRLRRRFGFGRRRSVEMVANMENAEVEKGMGSTVYSEVLAAEKVL
jgi:hypothetical protein